VLFRLEGVRGSEPPSCCPTAFAFWLDVLSFVSCKTGNPSTLCFLSKAGPEGLLSKKGGGWSFPATSRMAAGRDWDGAT
jgi:hypothetical protein